MVVVVTGSEKLHDIVVVSDFHMGRGKNPRSGRYYSLEAFFYDADFLGFCSKICEEAEADGRQVLLILNGDAFDFLRIESNAQSGDGGAYGPAFGPILTPSMAGRLTREILDGHPKFLEGLAEVLARGHRVLLLPGNHDIELQWEAVRTEIRSAVEEILGRRDASDAIGRLRFHQWFYYEPGRIWVEHGCQYDPENSFRYLLRRELEKEPDAVHLAEQDLPLGNFFQRYLYNDFGHITFIVPSSRANLRYLRWLLVNQPRLLVRVIFNHGPFVFQIMRRFAKSMGVSALKSLRRTHEAELEQLAEYTELGEKLHAVDDLKEKRADVVHATRTIAIQFVKALGAALGLGVLSSVLYFVGFLSIQQLEGGFGLKALLFLTLNLLALAAGAGALVYSLLRSDPPQKLPMRRAAWKIADIMDVPMVCFGHTHDEMIWSIGRDGDGKTRWYYNTGTWIAVFTHDVLMPRERVQYTFLRVRDNRGELLHWSPGRSEPLPVILLEQSGPRGYQLPADTSVEQSS